MSSITLLAGPPGAGKSTVSKLVATHFPRSLVVPVDQLREMMVAGAYTPGAALSAEYIRQFELARATAVSMAHLYAGEGIDVIIDDACYPAVFADHYRDLGAPATVQRILLLPNISVQMDRIKKRGGAWDDAIIGLIPEIYEYLGSMRLDNWIVLDTGGWTIDETIQRVLSHIANSGPKTDRP